MAGKNETPRQKMIGLMYLVLLAMLALNASKDLLNAFLYLDNGINLNNQNFSVNNQNIVDKIAVNAATGSQKAIENLKIAQEINLKSNSIISLIDQYKKAIIENGGGLDEHGIPIAKDNQDIGANYLIFEKKGENLRNELGEFKSFILKHIDVNDKEIIKSIECLLNTPDYVDYEGTKTNWENGLSEHLPLVAVTANLSNIQTYVQSSSAQVLSYLQEQISSDSYKVNQIMATVLPHESYVLSGDEFKAEIFLAAADTTQEPIIVVGNYNESLFNEKNIVEFLGKTDTLKASKGKGLYTVKPNTVGNNIIKGIMFVPHPNPKMKGKFLQYPFQNQYTVGAPTAVISSSQLQMMYMGIENIIEVSASGIQNNQITLYSPQADVIKKNNGIYTVIPKRLGNVDLDVIYTNEEGHKKLIGKQTWKSNRLPKPEIEFLRKDLEKSYAKGAFEIPLYQYFTAKYPTGFPVTTPPILKSCDVEFSIQGQLYFVKLDKGKFNNDFKRNMDKTRPGDKLEINIQAKTPDGITHTITEKIILK
jgi:gliding motility-associated protein GldM